MSPKKQLRNLHAKAYIQEVFESILRAEGFQCPDDRLLCWYRIHNEEVVNSIIFYTQYPNLPLMLGIGYGIFPSFQKPFYLSNVVSNDHPGQEEYPAYQETGSELHHQRGCCNQAVQRNRSQVCRA